MDTIEGLDKATQLALEGGNLHRDGNYDAARVYYDASLLLNPDHPIALQNLSGLLYSTERCHAALAIANRAVNADPKNYHARANRASANMHLGNYGRARREFEEILKVLKDDYGIWHNFSLVLYFTGNIVGAIKAVEQAMRCLPGGNKETRQDYGIFTLASGDIGLGLERYEARWEAIYKSPIWNLGIEEWKGQEIRNKHILLHHEQGFGDSIMLIRFSKKLRECGAKVTVAVPKELVRLFESQSDLADAVVDWGIVKDKEGFDYHVPMLSVMRWLGTTISDIYCPPYLKAPDAWQSPLGPEGKLRVGLCWASGDHGAFLKRRRRVVPLELFFPISELRGVRLVSLQKGNPQKDIIATGAESFIYDPMARAGDFYDTMRIIEALDMVISVDSAVAHLAGAMGKPTLMLGPYVRCWRWWNQTNGMPWYNDFKIFPQETPMSWKEAVQRVQKVVEWRLEKCHLIVA